MLTKNVAANVHPCENHSVCVCLKRFVFFRFSFVALYCFFVTPATLFATFFAYLKIGMCVCVPFLWFLSLHLFCFPPLLFLR